MASPAKAPSGNAGRTLQRIGRQDRTSREGRLALGVFVLAIVIFLAQIFGTGAQIGGLVASVAIVALLISIVSFGQGLTILSGGFDLSIPWTMTLGGVVLTAVTAGSTARAVWAIPLVLGIGLVIGALNGFGIVKLRLPPIVMTLAMNVVLEGAVLVYSHGTPSGFAPNFLLTLTSGSVFGTAVPIAAVLLAGVFVIGTAIQSVSRFGRLVYAVGDSPTTAFLSGVNTSAVIVGVYAVSGFAAVLGGVLLAGYSRQSALGMGDPYLLPSIAAVVLGGASVMGGRGIFAGTVAGAIFLACLQSLLQSLAISEAYRTVIFGVVILVSAALLQPGGGGLTQRLRRLGLWRGALTRRPMYERYPLDPGTRQGGAK